MEDGRIAESQSKTDLGIFVLALVVVGALFFLHGGEQEEPEPIPGGTNEERVAFFGELRLASPDRAYRDP